MDLVMARLAAHPPRVTGDFLSVLAEVAGPEAAAQFARDLRA